MNSDFLGKNDTNTSFRIYADVWLNSQPIDISNSPYKLHVVSVFQMLCPACVLHSIPQVKKAKAVFDGAGVNFIGLHSVFENHVAMSVDCLNVFMKEFRIDFPVAVDRHQPGMDTPQTMLEYQFMGTPTHLLVDSGGKLVRSHFGVQDDMALAIDIQKQLNF